jgi:ubiquinone/menaquinone biosynthesis C-methylase UbiE
MLSGKQAFYPSFQVTVRMRNQSTLHYGTRLLVFAVRTADDGGKLSGIESARIMPTHKKTRGRGLLTSFKLMSDATEQARPTYADELGAYHRAHGRELKEIVTDLPLQDGNRVLDVACGDGSYSAWLAERVRPTGLCVGFDLAVEYLHDAAEHVGNSNACELVAAKLEELPFARDSFDLIFCAHSLVSLPEPVAALQQMRRLVKKGGLVVVLENDALHQIVLPWPEEIELAVREAELRCYRATARHPEKRYAGRRLTQYFTEAGLRPVFRRTYATDRIAPLSASEQRCLEQYLVNLMDRISPFLAAQDKRELDDLINPASPHFLPKELELEITWLDFVCWGEKDSR